MDLDNFKIDEDQFKVDLNETLLKAYKAIDSKDVVEYELLAKKAGQVIVDFTQ